MLNGSLRIEVCVIKPPNKVRRIHWKGIHQCNDHLIAEAGYGATVKQIFKQIDQTFHDLLAEPNSCKINLFDTGAQSSENFVITGSLTTEEFEELNHFLYSVHLNK